ncbi:MAG: hypothetical protein KH365_04815 [Clostridiales bacterium]|nr:hypothetical protein [Clostridiales bacterium]
MKNPDFVAPVFLVICQNVSLPTDPKNPASGFPYVPEIQKTIFVQEKTTLLLVL